MPPSTPNEPYAEHQWTKFELQVMLALITKGAHLAARREKRTDAPQLPQMNAYENFATQFNTAMNGKGNYDADLPKEEIIHMLDELIAKRKNVVGKKGLVERQIVPKITRALRLAWRRSDGRDFDGSIEEWEAGRREKVLREDMIRRGLIPRDEVVDEAPKKDASLPLASDTYTSAPHPAPHPAPAVYAQQYTSRTAHQASIPATPTHEPTSYLDRKLALVQSSASRVRAASASTRGKKSNLSNAFIDIADDEDDDLAFAVATPAHVSEHFEVPKKKRILSKAALQKENDRAMNSFAANAFTPAKSAGDNLLGWMKDAGSGSGAVASGGSGGTAISIGIGSKVSETVAPTKQKRPGRNAARMDTRVEKPQDKRQADNGLATGIAMHAERIALIDASERAEESAEECVEAEEFSVKDPNIGPSMIIDNRGPNYVGSYFRSTPPRSGFGGRPVTGDVVSGAGVDAGADADVRMNSVSDESEAE